MSKQKNKKDLINIELPQKLKPLSNGELNKKICLKFPNNKRAAVNFIKAYGYYHGYKGHCHDYLGNKLKTFPEIKNQMQFDIKLKNCLFPLIMLFERKFKQTVLDVFIEHYMNSRYFSKAATLSNVFKELFEVNSNPKIRRKIFEKKDSLYHYFSFIYSSSHHQNFEVVHHYYDKYFELPIWAVFETIGINRVLDIVDCCPVEVQNKIIKKIYFNNDMSYSIFKDKILGISNLRNFVCHNSILINVKNGSKGTTITVRDYIENLLTALICYNERHTVNDFCKKYEKLFVKYDIKNISLNKKY